MKQINLFSIIALIAILFSSCGDSEKNYNYFPYDNDIEINGDLEDYIILSIKTPAKLQISEDLLFWKIEVPIELVKPVNFNPNKYEYSLDVTLVNKEGGDLSIEFAADDYWGNKNISTLESFKSFLKSNKGNIEVFVFEARLNESDLSEELRKELKTAISEISNYYVECSLYENDDFDDNESLTKASNGKDWDKILTDYESYTDKYIQLLKKANSGDMSAMAEYVSILEKAQALEESLSDADDEMTSAQLKKFMKIQQKLIDAASDL